MVLVTLGSLRRQLIGLFLEQPLRVRLVDFLAFGGLYAMPTPLPQLASAHFGGGGVLLQEGSAMNRTGVFPCRLTIR
jgi:hypothetical protein